MFGHSRETSVPQTIQYSGSFVTAKSYYRREKLVFKHTRNKKKKNRIRYQVRKAFAESTILSVRIHQTHVYFQLGKNYLQMYFFYNILFYINFISFSN